MKIDRLIGIIVVLLQNDKVTAQELSQRFEVSRRTISRDIEDICKAGIPIVTVQGNKGGISIMENYKIDKTVFQKDEIQSIYEGLSALDSVSESRKYKKVIDKFMWNKDFYLQKNLMLIDLSSHYKENLAPKISLLEELIENHTRIRFFYHNKSGGHEVIADPYLIIFQWSSWYVLAHEVKTNQFKLYKLLRITELEATMDKFDVVEIPDQDLDFQSIFHDDIKTVILFDESVEYRLIEDYGENSYIKLKDGKLRFEGFFTNNDYLISWILSFGNHAELLEPVQLRQTLQQQLKSCYENYMGK